MIALRPAIRVSWVTSAGLQVGMIIAQEETGVPEQRRGSNPFDKEKGLINYQRDQNQKGPINRFHHNAADQVMIHPIIEGDAINLEYK